MVRMKGVEMNRFHLASEYFESNSNVYTFLSQLTDSLLKQAYNFDTLSLKMRIAFCI